MSTSVAEEHAELLGHAARGDETAVAALYDCYAGPLYGFALRRLGDPQLAEELVQRVMTRLWQLADRYDPARGTVRTWVFTIARTGVVDLQRDTFRRRRADTKVEAPAGEDELDALLRAETVRAALDRLSREHREVLDLAYFGGLTQTEVAERLSLPLGTVKSRTYYALKALRLACDELGVEG